MGISKGNTADTRTLSSRAADLRGGCWGRCGRVPQRSPACFRGRSDFKHNCCSLRFIDHAGSVTAAVSGLQPPLTSLWKLAAGELYIMKPLLWKARRSGTQLFTTWAAHGQAAKLMDRWWWEINLHPHQALLYLWNIWHGKDAVHPHKSRVFQDTDNNSFAR